MMGFIHELSLLSVVLLFYYILWFGNGPLFDKPDPTKKVVHSTIWEDARYKASLGKMTLMMEYIHELSLICVVFFFQLYPAQN